MSSKPGQFILTTDYSAPRTNDPASLSVTVPGNVNVTAGGVYKISSTLQIGTISASLRAQIESSKDPGRRFLGIWQQRARTGTVSGSASFYDIFVVISRINSTTLELSANIFNPYGATLVGASGDETFTAYVVTLVSPFEAQ